MYVTQASVESVWNTVPFIPLKSIMRNLGNILISVSKSKVPLICDIVIIGR